MTDDEPELTPEERALRAELLASAQRLDEPSPRLEAELRRKLVARGARASAWWWLLAAAGVLAVVAGGAGVFELARGIDAPGTTPSVKAEAVKPGAGDPCATAFHATGTAPLIDDFEDGDARSIAVEGRGAPWLLHFDTDGEGRVLRYPRPEPRPEARPDNRLALHLTSPELRDWGANVELTFDPHACYDASAYAGLELWAKGKGRLYVAVQNVEATPRRWGGLCEKDCYNGHSKAFDLDSTWQKLEVRWSDLRQRGYDVRPLDPARINSIYLAVHAEDTPLDLWIDDLRFIEKKKR